MAFPCVKFLKNKAAGTIIGCGLVLGTYKMGLDAEFGDRLEKDIKSGNFEKTYPDGYHKECILADFEGTGHLEAFKVWS